MKGERSAGQMKDKYEKENVCWKVQGWEGRSVWKAVDDLLIFFLFSCLLDGMDPDIRHLGLI